MRRLIRFILFLFCVVFIFAAQPLSAQGRVNAFFSPQDQPQKVLQQLIAQARQEIYLQAYVFTSQPLAKSLIAAARRGVNVRILLDGKMHQRGNKAVQKMLDAGIELQAQNDFAAAHNKVLLIDVKNANDCKVVTGSYNFTWSAEHRNAENIIVVEGHCELAQRYLENWLRCEKTAVPVSAFPLSAK